LAKPAELPPAAVAGDGFDDGNLAPQVAPAAPGPGEDVIAGRPSPAAEPAADSATVAGRPQPPAAAATATIVNPALKGIDVHLDRGKQALAVNDYPAAMKAFKDATDFDKKNPHALHGIGLSHYYLNEQNKAVETLEKAVVTGANRAIVWNLGVVHMKANPMRAAKYVRDYLAKPTTPLDEPLQNMLGAALDAAGATDAKSGQAFADMRRFYFQYDARLAEARRDGNRRWGSHWISAAQADSKWKISQARVQEADTTDTEYGRAKIKTKKAEEKLNDLNRSFGLVPERSYVAARQGIKNALLYEEDARKRRDAARAALSKTEMPEFPKYLQFIPIDALTAEQHPQM
jgi:tetratricopeptide (TPR) repeat protein